MALAVLPCATNCFLSFFDRPAPRPNAPGTVLSTAISRGVAPCAPAGKAAWRGQRRTTRARPSSTGAGEALWVGMTAGSVAAARRTFRCSCRHSIAVIPRPVSNCLDAVFGVPGWKVGTHVYGQCLRGTDWMQQYLAPRTADLVLCDAMCWLPACHHAMPCCRTWRITNGCDLVVVVGAFATVNARTSCDVARCCSMPRDTTRCDIRR